MNCNKSTRRMIISIFWIVLGVALNVLCFMNLLDDFWQGFGVGLILVGVVQLVRYIRYRTNDDYKEKVDIEVNDERNKFLSNKSWAWTGYITVIGLALGTVAFRIMGQDELCSLCATIIALMAVVHLITYAVLRSRY